MTDSLLNISKNWPLISFSK